jgi:hypothetical protein
MNIQLNNSVLRCETCNNTWNDYFHTFSRGHKLFLRGSHGLFIGDDIWYFIDGSIDFNRFLEPKGWRELNICPICRSTTNKILEIDKKGTELIFKEIQSTDLYIKNGEWQFNKEI